MSTSLHASPVKQSQAGLMVMVDVTMTLEDPFDDAALDAISLFEALGHVSAVRRACARRCACDALLAAHPQCTQRVCAHRGRVRTGDLCTQRMHMACADRHRHVCIRACSLATRPAPHLPLLPL